MKKLNRKGFTLIELLAVIVILAIVLVVTIPSVIETMNDARDRSLQNAADTATEWLTKEYEIQIMGAELGAQSQSTQYKDFVGYTDTEKTTLNAFPVSTAGTLSKDDANDVAVLEAAGISKAASNIDINNSKIYVDGGKICVVLKALQGGTFYVNDTTKYKNIKCGSGCPTTETACS